MSCGYCPAIFCQLIFVSCVSMAYFEDAGSKPPPVKKQKTGETAAAPAPAQQHFRVGIREAPPPFRGEAPRVTGFEEEHLSAAQDAHLEAIIAAIRNGTKPPPPNPAAFGWEALSPQQQAHFAPTRDALELDRIFKPGPEPREKL
jgi:hypothetical protein